MWNKSLTCEGVQTSHRKQPCTSMGILAGNICLATRYPATSPWYPAGARLSMKTARDLSAPGRGGLCRAGLTRPGHDQLLTGGQVLCHQGQGSDAGKLLLFPNFALHNSDVGLPQNTRTRNSFKQLVLSSTARLQLVGRGRINVAMSTFPKAVAVRQTWLKEDVLQDSENHIYLVIKTSFSSYFTRNFLW